VGLIPRFTVSQARARSFAKSFANYVRFANFRETGQGRAMPPLPALPYAPIMHIM
jgi:hypothetical protein